MKASVFRKIRWQYFFSFLLVMLAVMVILLSFTYHSFGTFLTELRMEQYSNDLRLFCAEMEHTITNNLVVAEQLSVTNSITPFTFRNHPEKALQTSDALRVYTGTYDAISELYLCFTGDDKIYSSHGSYLSDRFYHEGLVMSGYSPEQMKRIMDETNAITILPEQDATGFAFTTTNSVQHIVPVVVPYTYSTGLRCGTMLSLVDRTTLTRWIREYSLDDTAVMLSFHGVPFFLYAPEQSDFTEFSGVLAEPSDTEMVTIAGKRYHLLKQSDSNYGVSCQALVPADAQFNLFSGRMSMLILTTLIAAAVGLTLITAMVESRIKPIMVLHDMLVSSRERTGDTPSVNELTQIRDSVQQLLTENQSMTEKIENMDVLRKSDFARRFITGSFTSQDEYLSMAEECRLNVDTRCYMIGILAKPSNSSYDLNPEKMNQFFGSEVGGVSRVMDGSGRLIFIAFADNGDTLMAFLSQRFSSMKVLCAGATMAVSTIHSDYHDGPHAYLEADMAFEMRFLRGNEQIICSEPRKQQSVNDFTRNQQAVERLRGALHMGDAEHVNEALNGISATMHSMNSTLFDFRCMYNDILNVISSEARKSQETSGQLDDLFRLSECLSLDDLDLLLRNACMQVMANRVQEPHEEIPSPVAAARELIASRFAEPELSVAVVAQEVGLTDSKLSVEFKKAYHMTPLEFITRKRMLQAKDLLLSTEIPIKDIAIECGYYDISAFNRRFKAYSGMTPQQYRLSSGTNEENV